MKILIVEDEFASRIKLQTIMKGIGDYESVENGEDALKVVAFENLPDLILLDIVMPGIDGYEVCRRLKSDPKTRDIPILFLTAMDDVQNKTKGFELGAVDYITKPFEPLEVKARIRTHLSLTHAKRELADQNEILEKKVKERTKELALTQDATIYSMATLAEYRDPETGGHIKRTQNYVKALAEHLKNIKKYSDVLNDMNIDLLYKSAPLHDIGKVGVPDHILLKPGKLTDDEFHEMKKHTIYGRDTILGAEEMLGTTSSFLRFAREISYSHHEKWDGSGYPEGIKGDEIPISGRIMAIADVYDALISKRIYKPDFSHEKAVKIIYERKGKHFDPDMVNAFMEIKNTFREIAEKFKDSQGKRDTLLSNV